MATIKSLSRNVKNLDTNKVIREGMQESLPALLKKNKEQLLDGLTNTGETVKPKYRNPSYARKKNAMNPSPGYGTPDLKLTGLYQGRMYLKLNGDKLEYGSTDEKATELEKKYDDTYGLNRIYAEEFIDSDLRPNINKRVTEVIGLKFGS